MYEESKELSKLKIEASGERGQLMQHDCCISQKVEEPDHRVRRLALNRRQKVYGSSLTKQKERISLPATTKAKVVRLAGETRKRFYPGAVQWENGGLWSKSS